jgi:cytochrome c-type biogenesis protein CcmH
MPSAKALLSFIAAQAGIQNPRLISLLRACIVVAKSLLDVMRSAAKHRVLSATYEDEIPRLRLGTTLATQSLSASLRSRRERPEAKDFLTSIALFLLLIIHVPLWAAEPPDLEEQTRALAAELRCVVCQNLSVADSPSEMAQQMRAIVREQLAAGRTPQEVRDFFVSKYGEWVLLKPKTSGVSLVLWVMPYIALTAGLLFALWLMRRWAKQKGRPAPDSSTDRNPGQLHDELWRENFERPDSDDTSPRAELLRERARLVAELRELEFDYQSGKHSESDFIALRHEIESKAASVMEKLATLPAPVIAKSDKEVKRAPRPGRERPDSRPSLRRWQLAGGGAFLLVFGLALGILLMQSLRPRMSEQDTITGDFMTGTSGAGTARLLQEGKQAFAQQDFAKAIDSFKQVLAQEPNQPEAHSYMGFILVQAGHGDGAIMAFEKALAVAPNFPLALWGKGMVLYREKNDYAGAREIFERLLNMMPPGSERNEVAKVLAEIPAGGAQKTPTGKAPGAPATSAKVSGTITIDPKLKAHVDSGAALFIMARRFGAAAGPPLAVTKIDKPTFPLAYSLGQENVMMQGTPFTGKINISVRLDKDGNAMTRETGNLVGEYRKNPAEVGSHNVDVVLDQIAP